LLPLPLVIDLDGTLLQTDSLHESALQMIRSGPARLLQMPAWILRGKAHLKHQVASLTRINAAALPYNEPLLAWLREQRAQGRRLVLCTAADRSVAESVASHLALFDEVIATDGERNLAGVNKAMALESRFGTGGFDYAGNSRADLPVWSKARQAPCWPGCEESMSLPKSFHERQRVGARGDSHSDCTSGSRTYCSSCRCWRRISLKTSMTGSC
jgi:hypothetical protein